LNPSAWMTVRAYGLRIGLAAESAEGLHDLRSILPPGAQQCECVRVDISYSIRAVEADSEAPNYRRIISYVDGQELIRSGDYRYVLRTIERHLKLYVAEYARRLVFIHAGVVAWKGHGVVIPGRTFSGKSTLVAALLRAGATYYSDEFAVVDALGRIRPYTQPIQLRDGRGGSAQVDPAEFPARVGRSPLTARLILLTRHREGVEWRPRRISRGAGLLALLENTVSARRDPVRALQSLNRMVAGAQVLKGSRGEAQAVVGHLVNQGYLPA
jgi:hypothetical protein